MTGRLFILLFCSCMWFLSIWYVDTGKSPNAMSRILPVLTFWESGTLQIDAYEEKTIDKSKVGDHFYSDKAPLPTFMLIPVYGFFHLIGVAGDDFESRYLTAHFLGSGIFGAGSFAVILFLLLKYLPNRESLQSIAILMLACYGSFLFVFAGTFYSHIISASLLLLSYIHLKHNKKYLIAGLFSGAAFLTEFPLAIIFPIWALLITVKEKSITPGLRYSLGILPSVLIIMCYNYSITGSPLTMLYSHVSHEGFSAMKSNLGFGLPQPEAIWNLIFTPYRGLLFYLPILIPIIIALIIQKPDLKKLLTHPVTLGASFYFLLITCYFMWWGGWSYGPRQLAPIAVLLVFVGLRFLLHHPFKYWKWLVGICCGSGLIMAWLAKSSIMYNLPTEVSNPVFELVIPKFFGGVHNTKNILTLFFDLDPGFAAWLWPVCFAVVLLVLKRLSTRLESTKVIE